MQRAASATPGVSGAFQIVRTGGPLVSWKGLSECGQAAAASSAGYQPAFLVPSARSGAASTQPLCLDGLQAILTTAAMAPALTTRWMWPRSRVSAPRRCVFRFPAAHVRLWSLQRAAWSWLRRRHWTHSCAGAWTACCATRWRLCCSEWRVRQGSAGSGKPRPLVLCRPSPAGMHTGCRACIWASVQQSMRWGPVLFMIDSLMCRELPAGSSCPRLAPRLCLVLSTYPLEWEAPLLVRQARLHPSHTGCALPDQSR